MEILEILNLVIDKSIDIKEAKDLLLIYIDPDNSKKIETILKLLSYGKLSTNIALNMLDILRKDNLITNTTAKKDLEDKKVTCKSKKNRRAARPLEVDEYKKIISLCKDGFEYYDENQILHKFRANKQLAMTFILQANLGLRISDVLKLKPSTFKNDKLEIIEKKTGKLQYRSINKNLKDLIYEYAIENNINSNNYIIKVKVRAIQKQLDLIVRYLKLNNISSHSFRKMFGVTVYNKTNGDIELLKELFNHSSIATTQRYIKVSQKAINEVSESIDFTSDL